MEIMIRQLAREEIERVWEIDRRETIGGIYYSREGELVLEEEHYDMGGWPPGESEIYTPILIEAFARGGVFYGAFDRDVLVGVVVLDNKIIGKHKDQLQLKFLHISHSLRKQGLGARLFKKAVDDARKLGANKLYISSTPSENTVNFCLNQGCVVTKDVDEELFELEPEDIHLEYLII